MVQNTYILICEMYRLSYENTQVISHFCIPFKQKTLSDECYVVHLISTSTYDLIVTKLSYLEVSYL